MQGGTPLHPPGPVSGNGGGRRRVWATTLHLADSAYSQKSKRGETMAATLEETIRELEPFWRITCEEYALQDDFGSAKMLELEDEHVHLFGWTEAREAYKRAVNE